MTFKIKILSVGKTKENWLEAALDLYIKRLRAQAVIECQWFKTSAQLEAALMAESGVVCLDQNGEELTSLGFSKFLVQKLEGFGSRLTFVIGDDLGLPPALKNKFPLISLSKLTFTHQMARLILLEQIYRAFEIAKSSPYHK